MRDVILLSTLSTNTPSQLNIFRHDGDSLGVNGTEIRVFEQTHQISLRSFLKRQHCVALEPQVCLQHKKQIKISKSLLVQHNNQWQDQRNYLEILGDLTNETLKRKLTDQQLSALLVLTNLTDSLIRNKKQTPLTNGTETDLFREKRFAKLPESDGSGTVTVRLLDSSRGRRRFPRRL